MSYAEIIPNFQIFICEKKGHYVQNNSLIHQLEIRKGVIELVGVKFGQLK